MSVVVIVELPIKPDRAEAFRKALPAMLPDTRSRPGCELVECSVSQDQPGLFVFVEKWAERADHEAYLQWRIDRGEFADDMEILAGPPTIRYLDPLSDL
jgi:quinol monooxygenase YgiN